MKKIDTILQKNKIWAQSIKEKTPNFFKKLAQSQHPLFLWIGCSDSRVPAEILANMNPGELFVHRNIANMIVHTDFNCFSVIQYAVEFLEVEQIIICGHYGCGGLKAAITNSRFGLLNNWLMHIRDLYTKHRRLLEHFPLGKRLDIFCKINVIEQVYNLGRSETLQLAWNHGRKVSIHGFVYNIQDGLLHNLGITVDKPSMLEQTYRNGISQIT